MGITGGAPAKKLVLQFMEQLETGDIAPSIEVRPSVRRGARTAAAGLAIGRVVSVHRHPRCGVEADALAGHPRNRQRNGAPLHPFGGAVGVSLPQPSLRIGVGSKSADKVARLRLYSSSALAPTPQPRQHFPTPFRPLRVGLLHGPLL